MNTKTASFYPQTDEEVLYNFLLFLEYQWIFWSTFIPQVPGHIQEIGVRVGDFITISIPEAIQQTRDDVKAWLRLRSFELGILVAIGVGCCFTLLIWR